ncbi:hypothetical protein Nos7524_2173 [Nostoc sp. PCC 7524]|uniref:hypothetical protein n=1 Tax=Nostoc sp. (strain ATCC 29411 / PCC 7524) TaxID=28072 RepID=UPI00029F3916|nr:hypothetical protein [Nostoc sp. PCC 7524]AFY48021.1 hypothetical protein Nos7524_2173 [Nostoc sp. PCC 7524]
MTTKSFSKILAIVTGAASILTATLGIPSSALAATTEFSCSAKDVYVEVSRLRNGTLRYAAFNIPTTLQRPSLLLNGGTVRRNENGELVYRFRNRNYLYAAIKDEGYGRVLVYRNNRLIATKYCGDV